MKESVDQEDIQQSMNFIQNCLHLQSTTTGCLGKALDDVLDTSISLASNLLLNRRDNFLKLCHRDDTDKDVARLRNASLTKKELFNSKVLSEVEQNFIQWSQINREPAFKKHRGDSYGSHSFADSKKEQSQNNSRMPLSRIFVRKTSRMIKTKDNLVPSTPTEALPEGVGAGGSDYMEVSTKYPGARLEG